MRKEKGGKVGEDKGVEQKKKGRKRGEEKLGERGKKREELVT